MPETEPRIFLTASLQSGPGVAEEGVQAECLLRVADQGGKVGPVVDGQAAFGEDRWA